MYDQIKTFVFHFHGNECTKHLRGVYVRLSIVIDKRTILLCQLTLRWLSREQRFPLQQPRQVVDLQPELPVYTSGITLPSLRSPRSVLCSILFTGPDSFVGLNYLPQNI